MDQNKLQEFSANAAEAREDEVTQTIERYAGAITSSAFLTVAAAPMAGRPVARVMAE